MKNLLLAIVLISLNSGAFAQTLLKDINTGADGSRPASITPFGNIALFVATDDTHGYELWKTDGTTQGTVMVKDIYPGANSSMYVNYDGDEIYSAITVMGNEAYFYATNDSLNFELWKTDGTEQGTMLVKDIYPGDTGSASSPSNYLMLLGNELYFGADNGVDGPQLWKSDGSTNGTVMVKKLTSTSNSTFPQMEIADNNLVYFLASNDTSNIEPFISDGTAQGTHLLKDIDRVNAQSFVGWFTKFNGKVFFSGYDGHNSKLFYTDGTTQGTVEIMGTDTNATYFDPEELAVYNGKLYFSAGDYTHGWEFWTSDGTDAGTHMVKDIWPGINNGYPFYLTPFDGKLFFIADDGFHGQELWSTDGTVNGTQMVKDIYPTNSYERMYDQGSRIDNMTVVGNTLYFNATDSIHGQEPWVTDGTPGGTHLLIDICPDLCSANPAEFVQSGSANGGQQLYFTAEEPVHGRELYHVALPTGIAPVDAPVSFRLLPNPANGHVMLVTNNEAIGSAVQVLDITGRQVSGSILTNATYKLNIETIPPGLYFVKLISKEGRVEVQKLVVE